MGGPTWVCHPKIVPLRNRRSYYIPLRSNIIKSNLHKQSLGIFTYVRSHPGITIFVVALLLRVALVTTVGDRFPVSPDTIGRYDQIALSMQAGKGFSINGRPTAQSGPLYPALLYIVYGLFGYSTLVVRVFLSVVDAGQCVLFYKLAKKYFGTGVSILTAILLIVSPFSMYSILVASTEVPFTFLHAALLLLLLGAFQVAGNRQFWYSGFVLGFASLCRGTALLLPFFLAPAFAVARRQPVKKKVFAYVFFLVAFTASITPWIVRNYIQFGRFIPIQTMGGVHLYYASPTDINPAVLLSRHKKMSPVERDVFFFNEGWKNIKNQPVSFVRYMGHRLGEMWYRTDSKRVDESLKVINGTLLALAAAGIYLTKRRWRELMPLYLVIANYIVVHLVLIAMVRYMVAVLPILFIFAAIPIDMLWTKLKREGLTAEPRITEQKT